jgi:hypothetical protein
MDNGGPAFAGHSYTVAWKSGSANTNELISCGISSATAVKGDGGYILGKAYLAQGGLTFTVPSNIASGNYLISCNNQSASLYANSPVFSVQAADATNGCPPGVVYSSTTGAACPTAVLPPTIDSFSMNSSDQTFSLSAHNYSTITFKADCGPFVHIVLSTDGTQSFPTDRASLCNAEQYYSKSSTNADPNTPPIVNQPLRLWDSGGSQTSYIGNSPTSNQSGSVGLTVKVCNTAGVCVEKTGLLTIYARG